MSYILDTDVLIYFLKGREFVVNKLLSIPQSQLYITIINHTELLFGAHNFMHKKANLEKIHSFLQKFIVLPFDEKASNVFAEQKTKLKQEGTLLADMDLMIGSIAIEKQMTLVTNNTKHFSRLKKLNLENWCSIENL